MDSLTRAFSASTCNSRWRSQMWLTLKEQSECVMFCPGWQKWHGMLCPGWQKQHGMLCLGWQKQHGMFCPRWQIFLGCLSGVSKKAWDVLSKDVLSSSHGKVTTSQLDITIESQEVSPAGDHKVSIYRRAWKHNKNKTDKTANNSFSWLVAITYFPFSTGYSMNDSWYKIEATNDARPFFSVGAVRVVHTDFNL